MGDTLVLPAVAGTTPIPAGSTIGWSGRAQLTSPVDGVLRITKADGTVTTNVSGLLIGSNDATTNGVRLVYSSGIGAGSELRAYTGDGSAQRGFGAAFYSILSVGAGIKIGPSTSAGITFPTTSSMGVQMGASPTGGAILFNSANQTSALRPVVSAKTSAYPVVAADSFTVFTNAGAGASVTFTLPAATGTGNTYRFVATAAQPIVIARAGSDNIQQPTGATVTTWTSPGTAGAVVEIVDVATALWAVTNQQQVWS